MKNPAITRVLFLQKKATEICQALFEILEKERAALIALNTENIMKFSTEKEHLASLLKRTRSDMHDFLKNQFALESSENFDSILTGTEKQEWLALRKDWLKVWEATRNRLEQNQKFMSHSLKNISTLLDNLKGLMGQKPTYSSSGSKVEPKLRTRVIEGRY